MRPATNVLTKSGSKAESDFTSSRKARGNHRTPTGHPGLFAS
jgi:hypothetical protein